MWELGFRQMTTSTKPINSPADLRGFKMRVPPSPISLSMFKDLGAAPMTLNAAEMYTGLQTHLADGQENPLGTIEANKTVQGAKILLHDQPHVGRLLGADQRPGLEGHAGEAAGCGRHGISIPRLRSSAPTSRR